MDYKVINVGSHVNPPPTMWVERFPKELRDRAPVHSKMNFPGEGEYEVLTLEGVHHRQLDSQIGVWVDKEILNKSGVPFSRSFYHGDDGQRDPSARRAAQIKDRVDADIIVHPGWPVLVPQDRLTRWGLMYAFNSWLADFCAYDPKRLFGIGEVPLWDMDLAVKEAKRIAKLGLKGILFPCVPGYEGAWSSPADYAYTHPFYKPLWQVMNELGLVIVTHIDAAAATKGLENYDHPALNMVINKTLPQEMVASLIFGHVFRDYPNLKIVCVETGVGWMAYFVSWMDVLYREQQFLFRELSEPPSATFRRHVFGSFLWDTIGVHHKDIIGIDNIMWCNDYPHSYGPWPDSWGQIEKDLAGVNAEDRHKILAGNAMRVFGIG